MKQKEYLKKVLKQVNGKAQILCDDCGDITKIAHAIINHQDKNIKIVCDNCFKNKYQDFICPESWQEMKIIKTR